MKSVYDVIIKPVITEESMKNIQMKKYTFIVQRTACKQEIANAVEAIFGVKVAKVNTMQVRGQSRRQGYHVGRRADWKKAIVTLTADSKGIEFFESMM
ncbi:MAG: 50S ribosomal protein L23 [Oscillospiraceae bacterium]|nr:50S ribosomal protein L23 [Oscillospiraceae bacterium]